MKTNNVKSEIIWKGFRLGNLFDFDSSNQYPCTQKQVDISSEKNDVYQIAVVAQSGKNNGVIGYIKRNENIDKYIFSNSMTFSMNFGLCFYHNYEYILLDTHGSIFRLIPMDLKLEDIIKNNIDCGIFINKIINKICSKSLYDWQWKPNSQRAGREIILLPCLEVSQDDEYIWEENGRYYTLAVEYIKELMEKAKERKEARTIRMYEAERAKYEAERAKYEAERAKYEAEYNAEKPNVLWKGFRLRNLFEWSGKHKISKTAKEYDTIDEPRDGYVANITAGKYNEGIANFIPEDDEITNKKKIDALTISSNGAGVGSCFFHDYYFISTGDNALLENKYEKLQEIFDTNHIVPRFFAKLITKICRNSLYSWSYKVSKEVFNREIILLPCLEVSQDDEYIWEENGRYYTLATNYISYLYLTGKMNKYQKLIDTYTYTY
jgi:hypothetical protein